MDTAAVVELTVPAHASYASLIRTATAAVCAQADFTVDALDDLRLAVTEAFALVLADAPPESLMQVQWQISGKDVRIDLQCPSSTAAPAATNTFSWTVLNALVDTVGTDVIDGRLHIRLQAHGIETTV